MSDKVLYLKGLNGIRSIAALGVLLSHTLTSLHLFGLNSHLLGTQDNGSPISLDLAGFGVTMFFSLSGFLITYLLFKEKKINRVNVKKFYMRRALRIWPLYYLYLIICLIVVAIYGVDFIKESVSYYVFFAPNVPFVLGTALPFLQHYWSLGVEEQFYLFWPLVMNKIKQNRFFYIISIIIMLVVGVKIILHFTFPDSVINVFLHVSRFHCMLIGAVFAYVQFSGQSRLIKIICSKWTQILILIAFIFIMFNQFHLASVIDNELVAVLTGGLILGQINGKGIINLEKRLLNFIGQISFGIYVIHPLVIFLLSKWIHFDSQHGINYVIVFISVVLITLALSILSYRYMEKPILRFKGRYAVVKSSNEPASK